MTETTLLPADSLAIAPRGLRAGLWLLLACLVLAPLAALPPLYATAGLGFLGTAAVVLCVRYKYHGRIPLNMETCFLAGMTIQYFFAPALVRVISGDFTAAYWRETAERAYVKDYYGPAMLIVLLFSAFFMLTSGLMPGPWPRKRVGGRIAVVFSRRTLIILILMMVNLWTARATLLATGSFYHVSHTKFNETDAYSALAQIDDGLGKMVIAFLWTGVFASGYALAFAVPYTVLEFAWNFIGGSREPIIIAAIIIGLTSYICKNRIPWKYIAISIVPLLLVVGFMNTFRYAAKKMEKDRIDLIGIMSAIRDQLSADNNGKASFLITALVRFNDLDSIAAIYGWTPSQQPFLGGETWERIPEALIPRQFTKDKKPVIIPINTWYFRHEGGTSPTTTPGEGYLNFGWIGVVISAVVCALLLRLVEWIFSLMMWNGAILPVYIATLAVFARLHTQPLAVWFTASPKISLFVIMLHFITRPSRESYDQLWVGGETPIPA